ncbi:MAG TPA: S-adenosyl-l-methionine hydroxide adenosyltransferase family protein [Candidatus Pseudogracilibacillus intestinigallinarum]|uniref:S-adenosyl-l-methionine hydroxide adenosyltransferase family protein n=1 Tax=Candidatus Pseudogracilibacillus intestinigallinarum TaxID=2838742 RepID=A0A9D1PK95_9BACI|nr:S-adenosyl-l-methionine hydroxide adenosyltransferase family protein [Candidatus Pseudogracilibacillus intestinigallinarum]
MTKHLVIQTDFGLCDGAVSAMYGVALSVNPTLNIYDLTHEIPQYNIWEGSYRLYQTISYWPEETVFISVVDPGVGTDRLSVVAKTATNQYIVTPNNGTLTHVLENFDIVALREIDETKNRLPNSGESYTFHGRDIYAYTGARLAAGVINFEEVGRELAVADVISLPNPAATGGDGIVKGNIDILDVRFGNLWTNISRTLFVEANVQYGDLLEVTIENNGRTIYKNAMTYGKSFADSRLGEPLLYVNSVDKLGVAINQGSFAQAYDIGTGASWTVTIQKREA